MSSRNLRVLIIDGHPAVGRGLKALVGEMPGLCVVGLATRGERGLAQAAEATPDVALVDADMPGLCSAAVIRLLRSRLPKARIVALGIYPERKWTVLEAGAHEFVLKDAGYEALRDAIAGGSGDCVDVRAVDIQAVHGHAVDSGVVVGTSAGRVAPVGPMGNEERVLS